jgi:hypothetical protein
MTEMRVFLAVLARSDLDIELTGSPERWYNFPLPKPANGLAAEIKRRGSTS